MYIIYNSLAWFCIIWQVSLNTYVRFLYKDLQNLPKPDLLRGTYAILQTREKYNSSQLCIWVDQGCSPRGMPWHPQILADQLTLSQPGNYYWHPRFFRPPDSPELLQFTSERRLSYWIAHIIHNYDCLKYKKSCEILSFNRIKYVNYVTDANWQNYARQLN